MIKKITISIFIIIILVAVPNLIVKSIWNQPTQPLSDTFIIPKGKGLNWVAHQLEAKQVIPSAKVFIFYNRFARLGLNSSSIKAGEFDLSKSITQIDLARKLVKGDVISHKVTLIDGWTFKQFKQHLAKQEILVSKLQDMSDEQI